MKISALKAQARAAMKGNWGVAILVFFVYALIAGAVSAIPVIGTVASLFTPTLAFGLCSFYLIMARTGSAKFETLFTDTFAGFFKKWGALLLQGLYICLWSLLFFIPGLVKSYSYAMTNYILLDNPDMGINEAITESRRMMKGYKFKLFCLDLSFILWHLLAFCTCGLLYLYITPLINASKAQFYEELKKIQG